MRCKQTTTGRCDRRVEKKWHPLETRVNRNLHQQAGLSLCQSPKPTAPTTKLSVDAVSYLGDKGSEMALTGGPHRSAIKHPPRKHASDAARQRTQEACSADLLAAHDAPRRWPESAPLGTNIGIGQSSQGTQLVRHRLAHRIALYLNPLICFIMIAMGYNHTAPDEAPESSDPNTATAVK